ALTPLCLFCFHLGYTKNKSGVKAPQSKCAQLATNAGLHARTYNLALWISPNVAMIGPAWTQCTAAGPKRRGCRANLDSLALDDGYRHRPPDGHRAHRALSSDLSLRQAPASRRRRARLSRRLPDGRRPARCDLALQDQDGDQPPGGGARS